MAGLPGIGNLNRRIQSLPQVLSESSFPGPNLSTYGSAGATAALGISTGAAAAQGICVIPNIPNEAAVLVIPTFSSNAVGGLAIWSVRRADDQAPAAQATLFQYAPIALMIFNNSGTKRSGFAAGALNFFLASAPTTQNNHTGNEAGVMVVGDISSAGNVQILVDALDSEFIALQFSTQGGGTPCQALYSYVNLR